MAEARTIPGQTSKAASVAQGRPAVERWLRGSGLVPLPAFLLLHLGGELARAFPADVHDALRRTPGTLETLACAALVWAPLGLHLLLGGWLFANGRTLTPCAADLPGLPRALSRWSALAAAAFLLYHARGYAFAVWLREADPRDAGFRLVEELSSTRYGVPLSGAAYLVGLLATATHAGIALHRALLALGYLDSERRRRVSARLCAAFGVASFCVGAAAVIRVASGVLLR